jgi:hypothetical protein
MNNTKLIVLVVVAASLFGFLGSATAVYLLSAGETPQQEFRREMKKARAEEKLKPIAIEIVRQPAPVIDEGSVLINTRRFKPAPKHPLIFGVKNTSETAVKSLRLHIQYRDPERAIAFHEQPGVISVDGGVEPGETRSLENNGEKITIDSMLMDRMAKKYPKGQWEVYVCNSDGDPVEASRVPVTVVKRGDPNENTKFLLKLDPFKKKADPDKAPDVKAEGWGR